ncbi:MAG: ABC transporter permease [Actinomycetota bacterium]|nr:ABC transporter permease [Actinomycetota bacterium]
MAGDQRAQAQTRLRWELLSGIIRKDLKVKYQGSVLGFIWSLANPLLLLVVYSFVFGVILKNGVPNFGYYLLSGLLVWNFFNLTVAYACGAVVANAGLVQKVPFPLAVLPLASVGFAMVHLVLQLSVLFVVMLITGYTVVLGPGLLLIIPALAVAILLATGVSFLVAALNVRYRDTAHIVEILLLAGFWMNPIVYTVATIKQELGGTIWEQLYWLNPMAGVTVAMQRALYAADIPINGAGPIQKVLASTEWSFYLERLSIGFVVAFALFSLGLTVYRKMSADFAEEL